MVIEFGKHDDLEAPDIGIVMGPLGQGHRTGWLWVELLECLSC